MGFVGFGDTPQSLPSQLGLTKFSYCLLSHFFNDTKESTDLILDLDGELEAKGLSYTPLIPSKSVSTGFRFYGYRYVILLEIVVGDTHIMIPDKFRVLGPDGNGGTILDAGSPYYQNVSEAFESQMGRSARAPDIGVLGSCFQLIPNEVSLYYPPLTLIFEGGAKMELSWIHYLLLDDRSNSVCLSFITDNVGGVVLNVGLSGGPSIILGNCLQQSIYMEFDLENSRLGFLKQACN